MKLMVRKIFMDYEKEEKWLNEMSAKGMALTDYSWCRYVFQEEPENTYTYRIELLNNLPVHPESIAYLRFLEENNIECVATYARWVYLRKKSSEGSFDIYTDIESKIKHFKRIAMLISFFMWAEFMAGALNVIIGTVNLNINDQLSNISFVNIYLGTALLVLGLLFFRLGAPTRHKIKKLKEEKIVRE